MKLMAWLSGVLMGTGGTTLEDLGVIEVSNPDEWQAALKTSEVEPVFVFKHSTTCPISASAYRRVGDYLKEAGDNAPKFYLVKVIESRAVSNEIAATLGVRHESPQAILMRGGKAVWHASHGSIDGSAMRRALAG